MVDVRSNTLSQTVQPSCRMSLECFAASSSLVNTSARLLVVSITIFYRDLVVQEAFSDIVVLDADMFRALGDDGMVGEVNGRGIVAFQVTGKPLMSSSFMPMRYQLACLAVVDNAIYFASVVEVEMECCLLDRQEIRQEPKRKQ